MLQAMINTRQLTPIWLFAFCFFSMTTLLQLGVHTLWGMLIQHGLRITSLRKQPTFGNATTGFPANDV